MSSASTVSSIGIDTALLRIQWGGCIQSESLTCVSRSYIKPFLHFPKIVAAITLVFWNYLLTIEDEVFLSFSHLSFDSSKIQLELIWVINMLPNMVCASLIWLASDDRKTGLPFCFLW